MEVYFRQKKMQTIMIYYNIIYCNKNIPMVRQNDEIRSHNYEIKSILDYFRSRNICFVFDKNQQKKSTLLGQ